MLSDRMEDALAKSYSEFREHVWALMRQNPNLFAKVTYSLTVQNGVPVLKEVTAAMTTQISKDVDKKNQ